jgi:Na+/H+-dicarboxylate symporter
LLRWYLGVPLLKRILVAFVLGTAGGCGAWYLGVATGTPVLESILPVIKPLGDLLVQMLKMIVIPVVFLSLVTGAASLPLNRFGSVGLRVILWYLLCSTLAAVVGALIALAVDPGSGGDLLSWRDVADTLGAQADAVETTARESQAGFAPLLLSMFENPFAALASGNFLAIIVFSILFGLAARLLIENAGRSEDSDPVEALLRGLEAAREVVFKLVGWILEYTPVGVLALSVVNFGLYGPEIAGPYVRVTLGVIAGVAVMALVVYPTLLGLVTRRNPYRLMRPMQEAIVTAFITRSSAAALPVTLRIMEEDMRVRNELASFSLPLGATVNMDGVCVHLPMFAVLAANLFGLDLGLAPLIFLVLATVLASIGTGGVPGGSLMLLFIILEGLGLDANQISVVVALALGINPILDMFETANNVTGDMVCTYCVAHQSGLLQEEQVSPMPAEAPMD